ncbi:hypothetical protein DB88DRAFT_521105 [Papiliotrema laurentii]|uniref:Uncharacterized protein n=1 Tax=Papiliotrema laurentii TaxID=5418 RepID=A0AAD9L7Q1_PAPLA|nr:hypothetical protein DB88DRAFT_521105 [Papiliotrema laurentii]
MEIVHLHSSLTFQPTHAFSSPYSLNSKAFGPKFRGEVGRTPGYLPTGLRLRKKGYSLRCRGIEPLAKAHVSDEVVGHRSRGKLSCYHYTSSVVTVVKAHILRIPKMRLSSQTVENRGQEKAEKANLGIGSFCSLCSNTATNSWLRKLFDLMDDNPSMSVQKDMSTKEERVGHRQPSATGDLPSRLAMTPLLCPGSRDSGYALTAGCVGVWSASPGHEPRIP